MIHLKSAAEIERIRASCRIAAEAMDLVGGAIAPGVTTARLDRIADDHIRRRGGVASAKGYRGYPSSICVSRQRGGPSTGSLGAAGCRPATSSPWTSPCARTAITAT